MSQIAEACAAFETLLKEQLLRIENANTEKTDFTSKKYS